jgi:phosphoribosylaminoimidazolecarboxamide formyltransferase/IMP cyclohydrolase
LSKIKTALISVSDKSGIVPFAEFLSDKGVKILSTGGTAKALRDAGMNVVDVSDHTGSPEIMDGRVKTLHPKIHGGILAVRDDKSHQAACKENDIEGIDIVIVNLYPFAETVAAGRDFNSCIENIDIGGPSMIRSAAKNHKDVVIVVNPDDYEKVMEEIENNNGDVSIDFRQQLAATAFTKTSEYDATISAWFASQNGEQFPETLISIAKRKATLRYGENPHQAAAVYTTNSSTTGIATAKQLQGKELSYNNIADAESAFDLVGEFTAPAVAIIKHANPCGVATGNNLADAYEKALACDPVSAYGSIIAVNKKLDLIAAEKIAGLFVEVVIAPDADEKALERLAKKKNLRVLLTGELPDSARKGNLFKTISGGLLVQERDFAPINKADLKTVSKRKPSDEEIEEMLFAFRVCKHVKSNAIVVTKDQATIGVGAGQMSRVDSTKIATEKSGVPSGGEGILTLASDAFFPFADGVKLAADAGIKAIIQPGGSIRDEEVIEMADKHDITMVFTGQRHFRH